MSLVAVPVGVVTDTVDSVGDAASFRVAVTVIEVESAPSARFDGLTLSVTAVEAVSSSVMVNVAGTTLKPVAVPPSTTVSPPGSAVWSCSGVMVKPTLSEAVLPARNLSVVVVSSES